MYKRIKYYYNRVMHQVYKLIPVSVITISDLFTPKPEKSFHIVAAVRNVFVECQLGLQLDGNQSDLYARIINLKADDELKDIEEFRALIDSMKTEGFNKKYPILMDLDLNVIDGTHRLAAAINLGINDVYVRVIPRHLRPIDANERLVLFGLNNDDKVAIYDSYSRLYSRIIENTILKNN